MTLLARVPMGLEELTQRSFLSRLAGVSGCSSAAQFCKEMGLDWKRICQGKDDQIVKLADLSGADAEILRRNTIRQMRMGSFEIRGCHVISNMLRTDEYALCPACIHQDVHDGTRRPAFERAHLRVPWHLRSIQTCPTHSKSLVTFALSEMRSDRRQFSAFGWDAAIQLATGSAISFDRAPTDFEDYVWKRLDQQTGGTWLDDMPLSEVTRLCEAFGGSIVSGIIEWRRAIATMDRRTIENAGYQMLKGGPAALREHLNATLAASGRSLNQIGLRTILGPAYEFMVKRRNETTDFRLFRNEVELFADMNLVANSNRVRLAYSKEGYTIGDLAKRFGLEQPAISGAARRMNERTPSDGKLDALTARRIVREAQRSWLNGQVRACLGISHEQLWLLADGGLLGTVKRGDYQNANRRFDPMVVEEFRAKVFSAVTGGSTKAREWISLSEAALRFRCGLVAIVRLLLEQRLTNVVHVT